MTAQPKASIQKDQPLAFNLRLEPEDNKRLANLCGQFDDHLRQIERQLGVEINHRGSQFRIIGEPDAVGAATEILRSLYDEAAQMSLSPPQVQLVIQESGVDALQVRQHVDEADSGAVVHLRSGSIKARTPNQRDYLKRIRAHDINFGVGPAGTGKTYLAVAAAVEALESRKVRRLVLARPAVEAGERLGFLPGDMAQKIDPYLRPLYDALYEMLGFEQVGKLIERHVIEVAPLAFMRGRTLNEAFVILDEAQNTTTEQMKMFLTRIGFGSTVVVNGDVTQVDLPSGRASGLRHVIEVLENVEGISFTFFKDKDVVRHPLVQRVVAAYENHQRDNA